MPWEQPNIAGSGYVYFDVTYWGHNWGVILAIDHDSGKAIYLDFISHEKAEDYLRALQSIKSRGFVIKGVIIDGFRALFDIFSDYKIQMCHFHMKQIVTRYLTGNPRLQASKELAVIVDRLTKMEYLFTYLSPECVGMPNTNNMIEGLFSAQKKRLNVHAGMKEDGRKRQSYALCLETPKNKIIFSLQNDPLKHGSFFQPAK